MGKQQSCGTLKFKRGIAEGHKVTLKSGLSVPIVKDGEFYFTGPNELSVFFYIKVENVKNKATQFNNMLAEGLYHLLNIYKDEPPGDSNRGRYGELLRSEITLEKITT